MVWQEARGGVSTACKRDRESGECKPHSGLGTHQRATWEGRGMGEYLDLLESVTLSSTPPKAFGPEHGGVAGVVAVGLAFMLGMAP